ncbi:MAG: DUF4281 domain-containing protein [Burkholderiales bacterium]|nr:MAG: DUF4281 domain-containing protein [Burkholderiales bacterium]
MQYDFPLLFAGGSTLAALGWLGLAVLPLVPRWRQSILVATGIAIPLVLAVVYTVLVALWMPFAEGGFGSIGEVRRLFADDALLVAGWLHYLAFDLFVGTWIVREAERLNVRHASLLPALALTFLFGPAGLLLFSAQRMPLRRLAAR